MSLSTHILVVDDDPDLLKLLSAVLIDAGHTVMAVRSGREAIEAVRQQPFDVVILDLMMPDVNGLVVCEQVRQFSSVPIIVLSALSDEAKMVQALDMGADEYLVKPFRGHEIRARIRAILRRRQQSEPPEADSIIDDGNLHVDMVNRKVVVADEPVHLTPTEYMLLRELLLNPNHLLSHEELLTRVWGPEYSDSHHLLHININRLRVKLAQMQGPAILTHPSNGYIFQTASGRPDLRTLIDT